MKAQPAIIVEIDTEGNPTISVSGVSGMQCKTMTRDIEEALGVVVSVQPTPPLAKHVQPQQAKQGN